MGCGASAVSATDPSQLPAKSDEKLKNDNEKLDGPAKKKKKDGSATTGPESQTVKKFDAFVIPMDDNPIDAIVKRHPPRRLQKLEPIAQKLPVLTAEMLEEKMRLADAKRERMLKKKARVGKKASRKRQEIMKAREQTQDATEQSVKTKTATAEAQPDNPAKTLRSRVDDAQEAAEKKRQEKLAVMKEKARLRDERLKSARERAQRIKSLRAEEDENIDYELDRMETAAADDDDTDSWLDGENNTNGVTSAGTARFDSAATDRVYSGRASPKKKAGVIRVAPSSASTVDSFSMAFQRDSSAGKTAGTVQNGEKNDTFFD